jgi:hypothetical protein
MHRRPSRLESAQAGARRWDTSLAQPSAAGPKAHAGEHRQAAGRFKFWAGAVACEQYCFAIKNLISEAMLSCFFLFFLAVFHIS